MRNIYVAYLPKRHDGGDKSAEEKADEQDVEVLGREIERRSSHSGGQHEIDPENDGEEEQEPYSLGRDLVIVLPSSSDEVPDHGHDRADEAAPVEDQRGQL